MNNQPEDRYSKNFQKILTKQGFKFKLNNKVTSLAREGDTVKLEIESAKDGKKETVCVFFGPSVV
jgi:dihydrolipoamide dehydrogenase